MGKKNNIEQIADILDADHKIRTWMFDKDESDIELMEIKRITTCGGYRKTETRMLGEERRTNRENTKNM